MLLCYYMLLHANSKLYLSTIKYGKMTLFIGNNISVLLCTLTNQMTLQLSLSRQPCEQSHWLSQMLSTKIVDIGSLDWD